jgi:hypothetical protein
MSSINLPVSRLSSARFAVAPFTVTDCDDDEMTTTAMKFHWVFYRSVSQLSGCQLSIYQLTL